MPSKKERIEELERKVEELEKKVTEQSLPMIIREREYYPIQPLIGAGNRCPNCGTYFQGSYHACWYYNPHFNPISFNHNTLFTPKIT